MVQASWRRHWTTGVPLRQSVRTRSARGGGGADPA